MPLDIVGAALTNGVQAIPYWPYLVRYGPVAGVAYLAKRYFSGTQNTWERDMHGRVIIITGGTSGIGAVVAEDLARKGAQLVLLVKSLSDSWLVDYIADLRERTENYMIYAEEADLTSLYSIRRFATKWLDNSPPRRIDMVICCAGKMEPAFKERQTTIEGYEKQWMINYLGHYHLLTLLSPALRVQPPDRDVRVILTSCATNTLAELDEKDPGFTNKVYPVQAPWRVFGSAKLALLLFVKEFQKTLDEYKRPDNHENKVRVFAVDPGFVRTATMRNFLTCGSLWGLFIYILLYPLVWIILKSPVDGAQSILHVAYSADCARSKGGCLYRECQEAPRLSLRGEVEDGGLIKRMWEYSAKEIIDAERKDVIRRKKEENLQKSREKSSIHNSSNSNSKSKDQSNKKATAKL
ncbi:hypothetical protein V1511DRAFT_462534 [Dipodascopsis uninucleata]